jgi:hypothetical protein
MTTLEEIKISLLRAGGVAEVVECLPNKREALSSKPQYHKKKNPPKPVLSKHLK